MTQTVTLTKEQVEGLRLICTGLVKTSFDKSSVVQDETIARLDALCDLALQALAMQPRPISEAPRDGTPVRLFRDMGEPWGVVEGWGTWHDVRGISGWVSRGFYEIPGELGLGDPTHFAPLHRVKKLPEILHD